MKYNNKRKNEMCFNILENIAYYELKSKILTIEILNTMKNPLKEGDIIKNWDNKCKEINQKKKAQKRFNNYIKRLRIIYNKINNGSELYNFNLNLRINNK